VYVSENFGLIYIFDTLHHTTAKGRKYFTFMFYPLARRTVKIVLVRSFFSPKKVPVIQPLVSHQHSNHEKKIFIQSRMFQTSNRRKASSSAACQHPNRLAKDGSVLAEAASSKLGLSSSSSYSLVDLPPSASEFTKRDIEALNITFHEASGESDVIPDVEGMSYIASASFFQQTNYLPFKCLSLVTNIPQEYILDGFNRSLLILPDFNVDNLEGVSDGVKTFIDKLHDITEHSLVVIGTSETCTDSLVDDLLRIVGLNLWPFKIQ